MPEERDCVVKLVDDHGVEHSVRVRAASVYEAALKGLQKLERIGWESDGSQLGFVTVEIWEEPTQHRVHVGKMMGWIKSSGRTPRDETRKGKLRALLRDGKWLSQPSETKSHNLGITRIHSLFRQSV